MNMIFKFIKNTDVRILILCLSAMFFLSLSAGAQGSNCTMVCKGQVNATLDPETCQVLLAPEDLSNAACAGPYTLEIINGANFTVATGTDQVTVTSEGDFIYKVTNGAGITCWGNISVEDKSGPFKTLQEDLEPLTEVCGVPNTIDPSGIDDLATELVSCVVEELGHSIEPWFDVLEESDFTDCSGLNSIHNFTTVIDFCDEPNYVIGEALPADWVAHQIHRRGWYAIDVDGHYSDTCYQDVITIRPSSELITLETSLTEDCSDVDDITAGGPSFVDVDNSTDFLTCPSSAGKEIVMTEGLFCGYIVSKHCDARIPTCLPSTDIVYKELCHWTVADWCTGDKLYDEETQILEVKDDTAPVVYEGDVDFYANPFDCTAQLLVGPASFNEMDECTSVTWKTIVEYGNVSHEGGYFEKVEVNANGISVADIPAAAEVKVTWRATDACGYIGDKTMTFNPKDDSAPLCIANDELNVGLIINDQETHTLAARVYAEDIDDSSYDNCQEIELLVRREDDKLAYLAADRDIDSLWAPYVEFSDEDLLDGLCEATYNVELLVREKNEYGTGLSTTCWGKVTIENKTAPIAKAPADVVVECTDHIPAFGNVEIWGACNSDYEVETETLIDDDCNYKVIYHAKRTWTPFTIVDGAKHYGKPVSQSIKVFNVHDIKIEFPLDMVVDCNADGSIPEALTITDLLTDNGCGQWRMNVQDKYYSSVDEADCKKIIREYEFINWCTWDYNRTEEAIVNRPDDLILEDSQQVVLAYADADWDRRNDIDDADDMDIYDQLESGSGSKRDGAFVLIDNGDNPSGLPRFGGMDGINGRRVNYVDGYKYGRFIYRQIIKIEDTTAPNLTGGIDAVVCDATSASCELFTDVTASFSATDNCSVVDLSYQLLVDGTTEPVNDPFGTFDGTTISGRYPTGTHAFVVTARDGCNNLTVKSYEFTVGEECKKPTPVGLATFTAVMENGNVEIWVSDIESGSSYDNCTAYDDLTFAVGIVTDLNSDGKISSADVEGGMPIDSVVYLNCSHVGKVYAALWVRDLAGNTQLTITPIYITDNHGDCDGLVAEMAQVSGAITNEADEEIDQVMMKVNGSGMAAQATMFDGLFNFNVPMNNNVTIAPEKNDHYLNGVSTSDLVTLQRHILGVKEINNAYNLIAADANNDQKINTKDMLNISRLILGVSSDLPNNTSWRFVAKDYQFSNPASPWGFAEAIDVDNLSADQKADFIGVKIGDVTGNAKATNLLGADAKVGQLNIAIADQKIAAGDVTEIAFMASDFNDVAGYQFTMNIASGVEVIDVVPGVLPNMTEANFGMHKLAAGVITTAWAHVEGVQLADNEVLFTIKVKAPTAINVSEVLSINSGVTAAEAYDNDLTVMDVQPLFIRVSAGELALYQNTPNPFDGNTTIGFELPQAGAATLKVMDISGRTLKVITSEYAKGYNQVQLDADDLNATGVLYYELTSSNASVTKKMVVIR